MADLESKVDTTYIYRRLQVALNGDDLALDISNLSTELAVKFHADTDVKIDDALDWLRPWSLGRWNRPASDRLRENEGGTND